MSIDSNICAWKLSGEPDRCETCEGFLHSAVCKGNTFIPSPYKNSVEYYEMIGWVNAIGKYHHSERLKRICVHKLNDGTELDRCPACQGFLIGSKCEGKNYIASVYHNNQEMLDKKAKAVKEDEVKWKM